jgi:hypothetical protein
LHHWILKIDEHCDMNHGSSRLTRPAPAG